jgi:hypothetical protein
MTDRVFRLADIEEIEAARRTIAALLARDLISVGLHDLAVEGLADRLSECRAGRRAGRPARSTTDAGTQT